MQTTVILTITHKKPLPELLEMASGRIYTMDGVDDVKAVRGDIPAHVESMQRVLAIGEFD